MPRFLGIVSRCREKKIGLREQSLEWHQLDVMSLRERQVGVRLIRHQGHAEHLAAQSHGFTDATEAGDAEDSAAQVQIGLARPATRQQFQMLRDHSLYQAQHQSEDLLRDGVLIRAWGDGHGNPLLGSGRLIDRFVTDADPSDDP